MDRLISLLVRRGECVTCGMSHGLQCWHFYSRRYLSVRFDLRNCNAMCAACNRRHNKDRWPYERYIRKTYGPGVVAELDELRMGLEKVNYEELGEMLMQYKALA